MLLPQFTTFIRQCCSFIRQWAWLPPVIQFYPPFIYALTPVYDFHPLVFFYPQVVAWLSPVIQSYLPLIYALTQLTPRIRRLFFLVNIKKRNASFSYVTIHCVRDR